MCIRDSLWGAPRWRSWGSGGLCGEVGESSNGSADDVIVVVMVVMIVRRVTTFWKGPVERRLCGCWRPHRCLLPHQGQELQLRRERALLASSPLSMTCQHGWFLAGVSSICICGMHWINHTFVSNFAQCLVHCSTDVKCVRGNINGR